MTSDSDRHLFQNFAKGSAVIKQDTVRPYRRKPDPNPIQTRRDEQDVIEAMLKSDMDPAEHENGDELLFFRGGIQRKVLRKLRRGEYVVEAELDLHGKRATQARYALAEFLRKAIHNDCRCVRIVHGKGLRSPDKRPVLKQKIPSWLRKRNEVLAFCSARHFDGGAGAIYVLLKRRESSRNVG